MIITNYVLEVNYFRMTNYDDVNYLQGLYMTVTIHELKIKDKKYLT